MKRRRKRRKRKSAGKTTHHHQQRAAGRHTSTHLIYYYYDSLIKLGDACDCERVSRQAGRQGENPRRKSPRESPDCPPHARQKSNLDASLVEPRLFQSFCLCDAGLLSVGWLPLGNEPRSPDPRARRRRLIPRFSSCVCSGSWRGDFSSALSLSLSLSLPLRGLRCACLSGLGWGRGPIRHHHKHGSSFLLPPHWDLLSPCCSSSYFRESSSRAHFTLRFPTSPRTESAPFPGRARPAADSGRAAADSAAKSRPGFGSMRKRC